MNFLQNIIKRKKHNKVSEQFFKNLFQLLHLFFPGIYTFYKIFFNIFTGTQTITFKTNKQEANNLALLIIVDTVPGNKTFSHILVAIFFYSA